MFGEGVACHLQQKGIYMRYKKSVRLGKRTETHYEEKLNKKNIKYLAANVWEQKTQHIDYFLKLKKEISVDVKTDKVIKRGSTDWRGEFASKNNLMLVEIHGRQTYNHGWLHGDADYIVFQMFYKNNWKYVHINRKDLLSYVMPRISKNKITYEHEPILWQQQARWDNPLESFVWVEIDEILNNCRHVVL